MTGNSLKQVVFLCIAVFVTPFYAIASHVWGADIGWKALGNDSFELVVHAYRDCNGISLSGTNLTYFSTSPGTCTSSTSASPSVCCATDITPICSSIQSRCANSSSSFAYGIQQIVITGVVKLAGPCCKYTIAWEECCRSNTISTGAAGNDYYIEAYLNRCLKPVDNSPYFTMPPVCLFGVNQCVYYNMGCEDIDRDSLGNPDSLVYSFASPWSGPGSDISYLAGYSDSTPLIYSGTDPASAFVEPYCLGFHIDRNTGEIEFKATKSDITTLVIVVDEYRKDSAGKPQWIGSIKRDVTIACINTPNNHPPLMLGINGGNNFSIKICAGIQTCLQLKALDLDPGDTDVLKWNNPNTIPGATFVSDHKKWPTGIFCWKPQKSNIRSAPYTFVTTVTDNACPLPGRTSRAFQIYVGAAAPAATYTAKKGKCGLVNFSAGIPSLASDSDFTYTWAGDATPGGKPLSITGKTGTYIYSVGGVYHYNLAVAQKDGCTQMYYDSISIPALPVVKLSPDTTVCTGTTVNIKTIPASFPAYDTVRWSTGARGSAIHPVIKSYSTFEVYVIDSAGCKDSATIKVKDNITATVNASQSVCLGRLVTLGNNAVDTNVSYTWTSDSGFTSSAPSPQIYAGRGPVAYFLKAYNSVTGCTVHDTIIVTGLPVPTVSAGKDEAICAGTATTISTTAIAGYAYQWTSIPAGFNASSSSVKVTPQKTIVYIVTAIDAPNCTNSDSVKITVLPLPNAGWTLSYNQNKAIFLADDTTYTPSDYSWDLDGTIYSGYRVSHLFPANNNYPVSLKIIDGNGCKNEFDSTLAITKSGIPQVTGNNFDITAFPNPFDASLTVQYYLSASSQVSLELMDMTGKIWPVFENQTQGQGPHQCNIATDTYHLHPGIYILKLSTEGGYVNSKIVKL